MKSDLLVALGYRPAERCHKCMGPCRAAEPRTLPSFALGARPTRVVQVGREYAAVYADTGEVIDHFTCIDPEDAARRAMRAAMPADEDEPDEEHCAGGCQLCCEAHGHIGF